MDPFFFQTASRQYYCILIAETPLLLEYTDRLQALIKTLQTGSLSRFLSLWFCTHTLLSAFFGMGVSAVKTLTEKSLKITLFVVYQCF